MTRPGGFYDPILSKHQYQAETIARLFDLPVDLAWRYAAQLRDLSLIYKGKKCSEGLLRLTGVSKKLEQINGVEEPKREQTLEEMGFILD